jgi:hypothetical protein
MRLVHHAVIEKATGKRVFIHCEERKCREFLNTLANQQNYTIGHKWLSI